MQNTRRNLGIFIIVVGLIILILVIYFGFLKKNPVTPGNIINQTATTTSKLTPLAPTGTTTPSDKPSNHQVYNISKEAPHQFNTNDLAKMAMAFSERFGSFSNQSDYGNFTDLKIFMTDDLKNWVNGYVQKIKSENKSKTYYGIVTRALTVNVKSFDDKAGQADVIVTTQRSESTEKINGGTPYKQNLELKFKKVGSDWLVDAVYWQK